MNIYNISAAGGVQAASTFPLAGFLIIFLFFVIFFTLFINAFYDVLLCKAKIEVIEKKAYKKLKLVGLLFFIMTALTMYLMYEFYLPHSIEILTALFNI